MPPRFRLLYSGNFNLNQTFKHYHCFKDDSLPGWFDVGEGQVDGSILETGRGVDGVHDQGGGRQLEELGDVVQHGEDGHRDHECLGGVDVPGTKLLL